MLSKNTAPIDDPEPPRRDPDTLMLSDEWKAWEVGN